MDLLEGVNNSSRFGSEVGLVFRPGEILCFGIVNVCEKFAVAIWDNNAVLANFAVARVLRDLPSAF